MHEATVRDFEIPARYGLNQTIADTIGVGGIFRGLRTFPVLADIAAGHGRGVPGRVAAQLHQPDGHERHVPAPRRSAAEGARPVPLGVLDDGRLVRAHRRAATTRCPTGRPASTTRRGCCGGSAAAQNLYPLLDERIAADPELRRRVRVDMYRRLGYYPTETSEHSSEYVPWYLRHPDEVDRLRINVGEYVSISEANMAEYRARASRIGADRHAAHRHRLHGVRAAGDPLAGDRDDAGDLGQRRQRRADHQPARRCCRRGADAARCVWARIP